MTDVVSDYLKNKDLAGCFTWMKHSSRTYNQIKNAMDLIRNDSQGKVQ